MGGIVGGTMQGAFFSISGSFLRFYLWRDWILLALGIFALWHSLSKRSFSLGRPCQVNRHWQRRIPAELAYFLWGVQLGCGVATFIPYSCFIVLIGVQATSGIHTALLLGTLFGGTREATVFLGILRSNTNRTSASWLRNLLPILAPKIKVINILWIIFGVLFLLYVRL